MNTKLTRDQLHVLLRSLIGAYAHLDWAEHEFGLDSKLYRLAQDAASAAVTAVEAAVFGDAS